MLKLICTTAELKLFELKDLGEITLNEEELLADLRYGQTKAEASIQPRSKKS